MSGPLRSDVMDVDDLSWPTIPLAEWAESCADAAPVAADRRQVPHGPHAAGQSLVARPPCTCLARGVTTAQVPALPRAFEIEFDFIDHVLVIRCNDGSLRRMELRPRSVADFYRELQGHLRDLAIDTAIVAGPNEVADAIPFDRDESHASYDRDYVNRFWRSLVSADRVFRTFRASFIGKCSPVHLFWGAPDLAVTRFSGRPAPPHPGGIPNLPDSVTREAYSHEVSSAGFWPGGGAIDYPAFYSYAYPEPEGFASAPLLPSAAFYSPDLREFILPYDAVREAAAPEAMLLAFLQTTYDAAANLGRWDRAALERGGAS